MENSIERTFYSDASHNYMVIECPHELKDNYQYKMLAANEIRGLLSCSSRSIDNREYLYYDITSRQSLEDVYDRRPVRGADLENLLEDLLRVEKTLTEYLLDATHMILEPSCIYVDFRGNESSFVYYPGETGDAGWETLFAFLADRVDGKDKRAAALVYRLCMMAEKPGFRLKEETLEELGVQIGKKMKEGGPGAVFSPGDLRGSGRYGQAGLKDSCPEPFPAERPGNPGGRQYVGKNPASNPGIGANSGNRFTGYGFEESGYGFEDSGSGFEEYDCGFDNPVSGETEYRAGRRMNRDGGNVRYSGEDSTSGSENISMQKRVLPYLISALAAAAGAVLFLLDRFFVLGEKELLLSRAAGGLLLAAGILSAIVRLIRRKRKIPEKEQKNISSGRLSDGMAAGTEESLEELMYGNDPALEQWDSFGDPGRARGSAETDGERRASSFPMEEKVLPYTSRENLRSLQAGMPDADAGNGAAGRRRPLAMPGETSLLGPDTGKPQALYGVGTCRGEKISLTELPCVVGKIQEYVDQVLDDSSVSRMHARFSMDREGEMTVRDLNSTNGTWLNGERLMPNESRTMRQGDHIRLGRMEFVYR